MEETTEGLVCGRGWNVEFNVIAEDKWGYVPCPHCYGEHYRPEFPALKGDTRQIKAWYVPRVLCITPDDPAHCAQICLDCLLGKAEKKMTNNILAPIELELRLNWESLKSTLMPTEPIRWHPEYYDPTRQIFKFRDDALTYALVRPQLFAQLEMPLAEKLIVVSKHIRFINLQIDELLTFRFSDPTMLSGARAYMLKATKKWGKFPPPSRDKIPRKFRAWFQELALRHWAIVNEGCHKRLKLSLPQALELLGGGGGRRVASGRWSDHCDDVCPYCGEHTGLFAFTYRFNNALLDCPLCGQTSISGFDVDQQIFRWFELDSES